ncbi:MAG TPA: hypothetical protein VIG66_03725 [Noviherbaspirillum sp.]
MLAEVSVKNEMRPGFLQASYKKANAPTIVLLFNVKKDVVLPNHKHGQHQFGYTFFGEYDFLIDGTRYLAVGRDSYHIEGGIYHAAVANSDYYSMDFKYIGKEGLDAPVAFNPIVPSADAKGNPLGEVFFNEESQGRVRTMQLRGAVEYTFPPIRSGLERALVVSAKTTVWIDSKPALLEPMKIYRIESTEKLNLKIEGDENEAFLYEI